MTIVLAFLFVACSGAPATPEPAPAPEPAPVVEPTPAPAEPEPMAPEKPPEGAKVFFVSPADGAEVTSPVKVVMGVEGMTVQPAGQLTSGTGHHHLLIDTEPAAFGAAVPADDKHIHFGKGQTEAEVELTPGPHTLMLQFADGVHRAYGETMTAKITVTVK
jgi:hypothetical protein